MRRTWWWRAGLLASGIGAVLVASACGGAQAELWAAWQRVLLSATGGGTGLLRPGERPLLYGPMPVPAAGQAAALDLRLTCTSGPGVVLARWWYDDPLAGPTSAAEAFGWGQDQVELRLGPGPLETVLGHFSAASCARLYCELGLPEGRAETTVEFQVTLLQQAASQVADLEPNNTPQTAKAILTLPAPGVLCPVFGDTTDYYRALPTGPGAGLEVVTTSPDGGPTIVDVTTEDGIVLGSQTGGAVDLQPLLGDLPAIGRLFRTRPELDRNNHLLIQITPRVVAP